MAAFSINRNKASRLLITDLAVLAAIYLVPGLSHMVGAPLYYMDPMRFFLLLGYFLTGNKSNAFLLGLTIPFFSWAISGHPLLPKAVLIAVELLTNLLLLSIFIKQARFSLFPALILSIIGSKVIYYFLKYMFIKAGILDMELIATGLLVQTVTVLGTVLFFGIIFRNKYLPSE